MRSTKSVRRGRRAVWLPPRVERLETRVVPGFVAPLAFDAGTHPSSVAVGDFNGDGILDLAVANFGDNFGSGNVSVLLGNGDGTFQPAHTLSAGNGPHSVAVGDFNGDGVLDLAVANYGSNNVSVLLGNGDGTFQAARNFAAGTRPESVAVGDFNGDGVLDLAVASYGVPGSVSVLLGNGDGTFQAARNLNAGLGPYSVAVGDFNGDSVLDLAVTSSGSGKVSVLLGNGDGTFQAPHDFNVGTYPESVAVGDFNGDGVLDLAVANRGSNNVSELLGNGDGTFQAARNFNAGTNPRSVAVGDFNGDGVLDLAVANYRSNNVSVLLGNGDGTFQAAHNFNAGTNPRSVAAGDFNGDGVLDLALANSLSNNVSVLLGNGDGTIQAVHNFNAGLSPHSVAVGDFNGDGVLDLALANRDGTAVSVLLGNSDGTFQAAHTFHAGTLPSSVAVGDFNGDGVLDLAVASFGDYLGNGQGVSVLLGNGEGTFQAARNFNAGTHPDSVAVGDFNGDGVLDLAVANYGDPIHGINGSVSVLMGNGDGTFEDAHNFNAGTLPSSVAVGDFNGDGVLDLAVASFGDYLGNGQGVSVLLGNGDGTFQAARNFNAGTHPDSVAVGDFNGDGVLDLAVANYGDLNHGINGSVSVLLGNGDGTFQAAHNFNAGPLPFFVAVGDFNGDGALDLIVNGGTVRVLLGNGDGTFQTSPVSYVAGSLSYSMSVADFNGDGFPDLAVANSDSNDVSILLNDGLWPPSPGGRPGGRRAPGGKRHSPTEPFASAFLNGLADPLERGGSMVVLTSSGNLGIPLISLPLASVAAMQAETTAASNAVNADEPVLSELHFPQPRVAGSPRLPTDCLFGQRGVGVLLDPLTEQP